MAWEITEVSNSAKRKVDIPKTEQQMYRFQKLYLHTILHFPVIFVSLVKRFLTAAISHA